jgi:hypothetical protein
VRVPTDSHEVVKALAVVDPCALVMRCRGDGLARLPGALGVANSGPNAAVALRILARAQLLDRLLYVGDDPGAMARTFRAQSLRLFALPARAVPRRAEVQGCRSGARPA